MVTLKPRDFRGSAYFSESFISNGHWIARRSAIENQALYASEEGARAALKIKLPHRVSLREDAMLKRVWPAEDAVLVPWTLTAFVFTGKDAAWRLVRAGDGQGLAVLDDAYLQTFGAEPGDTLYRVPERDTFFNGADAEASSWGVIGGRNYDMIGAALRALALALPEPIAEPESPAVPPADVTGGAHE